MPGAFRIESSHPSPFARRAAVTYELAHSDLVRACLFDVLGRRKACSEPAHLQPGRHEALVEGAGLAPGLYALRLGGEAGSASAVLIKTGGTTGGPAYVALRGGAASPPALAAAGLRAAGEAQEATSLSFRVRKDTYIERTLSETVSKGDTAWVALTAEVEEGTFTRLGPEDLRANRIKVQDGYLYALDHWELWRREIRSGEGEWELVTTNDSVGVGAMYDVVAALGDPDRLMVATGRLYRSTDGGSTWSRVDDEEGEPVPGRHLISHAGHVSSAATGVYASTDFGEHWEELASAIGSMPIGAFAAHPADPEVYWAGVNGNFWQRALYGTYDGWQKGAGPGPEFDNNYGPIVEIALDPQDVGTIYVVATEVIAGSTDRGATWTDMTESVPFEKQESFGFYDLVIDSDRSERLWLAARHHDKKLLESRDAGASWQVIEGPLPELGYAQDLAWDEEAGALYLATSDGVYRYEPK